jgi:hypothetical protein
VLTFRQRFFDHTITLGTGLGRVPSIDFDEEAAPFLDLFLQQSQELSPSGVSHTLADHATGQAQDVQVLNGNNGELMGKAGGKFVLEVQPLPGDRGVQLGDLPVQGFVRFATFLAPGTASLQDSEFGFGFSPPSGVVDQFPGRKSDKGFKPHIKADSRARYRMGSIGWRIDLEHNVSVPSLVTHDDRLFDRSADRQWAMLEEANFPDVLNVQTTLPESDTIVVDVGHRSKCLSTFILGVSWLVQPLFDAAKEVTKCLVQSAQSSLQRREIAPCYIGVKPADNFQLHRLVVVRNALATHLPSLSPLGQGIVVHPAVNVKDAREMFNLYLGRVQAILVCSDHFPPCSSM